MKENIKKTNPKLKSFDGQECKKCEYQWYPRKEKPRQCPNCKRQIKYKV
jgi:rubrerythrin